jgi:hypothetical protein
MKWIRTFESYTERNLIIVDVQKSFSKYFTPMYINELTKHCNNFENVYYIWDNHHEGKNVDKDYLYEENPEIPINDEFYNFPNVKEWIEKRYNYDVDANFYNKILSDETFEKISELENQKSLKKGDIFPTTQGTHIVYIGNNHKWFHLGKKLYKVLWSLKGKTVEIVGGADSECCEDIFTTATSLGVNINRNWKYIWTASSCPIK